MPPGKLRFAIVGCGYVADNYMFAFGQYPEAEMLRAFDIVPEHAARFTAHWGVPSVTTMAEFLDGLEADLVLNLTNPGAHFEVSKALLEAGFPVYSEKPLGMRFEEVEALAALAAGRGLALAGAPCNHLAEAAEAMRRALAQDRIGRPLLAYAEVDDKLIAKSPVETWRNLSGAPWPFEDEFRVGCTLEHAGYYLTWLVAAFGPIESVTAFAGLQYPGKPVGDGVEGPDFSVAALKFASGMAARLTCSVIAPKDHALRVFGDAGELTAEDCWFYQTPVRYRRWMRIRRRLLLSPWSNRVPLDPPPVTTRAGSAASMDFMRGPMEILRAAREGRPSRLPTDFCVHVNEAALAIHHAAETPGLYRMKSSCTPPAPAASPHDARHDPGFLDRHLPPLFERMFPR